MDAVQRDEDGSGGGKGVVRLVVARAGSRWEARAFAAALGANTGRRIGIYDDVDAAIREATEYGHQIEARGYEVHLMVGDQEGEPGPRPPLPLPRG
jgi:hypothetical protein